MLIDTVGFLSNLPHNLITAFHSTLQDMINAVSFFYNFFKYLSFTFFLITQVFEITWIFFVI